jgi:hypothetical protein
LPFGSFPRDEHPAAATAATDKYSGEKKEGKRKEELEVE